MAAVAAPVPALAQANADAYLRNCAMCHGPELRGGETGPTLIGSTFPGEMVGAPARRRWSSTPAHDAAHEPGLAERRELCAR